MNLLERARIWLGGIALRKDNPSYGISAQFFSPGAPLWTSRDYRSYVSQGYRRCGTVYTCINKIASAAAGIKWKLYTDQSCSREITSHPLLDLWRAPHPRTGSASFVEQCFGYWHLSGNCYLYANRPRPGEPPVELWPLRPDYLKIVAGQSDIGGYVYGYGTMHPRDFDVEEILHLKFPAYDDEFYGLSPIEVAMQLVDQQNEGNAWNTALMQNAGKPASVFMSKGYLTVEQRTQVRQELLKRYSGKRNAGMPLVLEADMTWQSMAMSPYELDWLESRELNTREIAAIFDVAPELVGDAAGKTFANQKEAKQSLYTENVLPKLDRFAGSLNTWLLPMYEDLAVSGAWFTYDRRDIEVLAELYTAQQQQLSEQATNMWNDGLCSLRYAQQLHGMPARPKVYLDVYKFGAVLVREEDLEAYALQALQKPAAPPQAIPEPLLQQTPPALPAPDAGQGDGSESGKNTGKGYNPAPGRFSRPFTTITEVPEKEAKAKAGATGKHPDPDADRAAYQERLEGRRASWESQATQQLSAHFQAERERTGKIIGQLDHADAAPGDAILAALGPLWAEQRQQLTDLLTDLYRRIMLEMDDEVRPAILALAENENDTPKANDPSHTSRGIARKGAVADFIARFGQDALNYLLTLCGNKITQITTTTQTEIRLALTAGVVEGESIPQLAARLDELYLQEIIPNRSTVIARTEVVAASNYGAVESAKAAATDANLALEQVWLATGDHRTRLAHLDADGQTVALGETFTVGGEELAYPGDPAGSASNIVQCRCTVYFQRAEADTGTGTGTPSSAVSQDQEEEQMSVHRARRSATRQRERKAGKHLTDEYDSVREYLEALLS